MMMQDEIRVVRSRGDSMVFPEGCDHYDDAFLDDMNLSLSAKGMLLTIRAQKDWYKRALYFTPHNTEELEAIEELIRFGYIEVTRF